MTKRVAVIGLSFRFPGTDTLAYWDDLLSGKDLVTEVDAQRWSKDAYLHPDKHHTGTAYTFAAGSIGDISRFDAAFFGISPREAALMDPQQRVLLEMCWEALEHAGIKPKALRGSDTGVYIGIASADYSYRLSDDFDAIDASFATGNTASIAANRLSYAFDLRGPSMAVDTACSSSLVAFHQACRAIVSGEVSHAIAGGISLHLHPYGFITFSKASMLSRRGRCSVFDAAGDGYVRSEGGGLFVLKDYDQAVADGDRIIGVIAHSAVNTDGKKSGLTVPSADAQVALMARAYAQAGVSPNELDYLEAHGTGTAVGDPIETHAIGRALGQQRETPLPIGSVKSNMGHLEAASGVAGLVKALYCLQRREVPATIGIDTPNPAIKFDEWNLDVVTATRPLKAKGPLTIGVNSFGFGGANAHIILQSHETDGAASPGLMNATGLPIVISGKTPAALADTAAHYADALAALPPSALYDFAYQANYRREWHEHRAVVFGTSARVLSAQLKDFAQGKAHKFDVPSGTRVPQAKGAAFVYSGNGSQWAGMGRALLDDPVFAEAIADIDTVFLPLAGYSLLAELQGALDTAEPRYQRTEFAQPALFAVQVGMTRMLMQSGVRPAAVIGHSVGEVAAAWACGALTLADATRVIYHRSRLQGTTRGNGAMTAVGISGAATQALLDSLHLSSTVNVAGYNSTRGATVAGHPDDLAALERVLAERNIFFKRLDLDYAFHSPAMEGIQEALATALAAVQPSEADIPFYSAVTGQVASGEQLDADYWWRNIREAVQFESAAGALVADGINVHVEIGPHPVLRGYVSDALKAASLDGRVLTTGLRDDDGVKRIRAAAGLLLVAGADLDLAPYFPVAGRHMDLPAYPWQREVHWHAVSPEGRNALLRVRAHSLLGWPLRDHESGWENHLDTRICPSLADHVVGNATVFPGTGFVEMALAAAFASQQGDFAVVEEIEIRAPLLLEPDQTKIVQTLVDSADGRFTISAKTHGAEDGFSPHASGRILAEPTQSGLEQSAPQKWPTRAPDFVGADHTALTELVGLAYGPAYRAVSHGWNESAECVLACFQPDPSIAEALETSHIHPALLDNAFQLIIQLLKDDPAMHTGVAFVPAKVGRVVARSGTHVPFAARATLLRRTPHGLVARFELFDSEGSLIAIVEEARFKSIRLQKTGSDQLSFVDYLAIPGNRATPGAETVIENLSVACITAALQQQLSSDCALLTTQRFATEVDPLADALVAQFVREALLGLADANGHISSGTVQRLRQQHPERATLLNVLLTRSVEEGGVHATAAGWTFDLDAQQPPAIDIWNSLVREYPDYFAIVQAIGRVGLHLQDLIHDRISLDAVLPREATAAHLASHIQGSPVRHAIAHVLGESAQRAQAALAAGERLRVLELGGTEPLAGVIWCSRLSPALSDYRYVSADADALASAQRLKEAYPEIDVQDIAVPSDDATLFDHAFVDIALMSMDEADRFIRYAQQRLKPGATLAVFNTHPSNWLDAVFGTDPAWWAPASDGSKVSRQQTAAFWTSALTELGLQVQPAIDTSHAALAGAYVLLAQIPASKGKTAQKHAINGGHAKSAASSTSPLWVLVAQANEDLAVAQSLAGDLKRAGHRVEIIDGSAPTEQTARVVQAHGAIHGLVHLRGLTTFTHDAGAVLAQQTERCTLAAQLAQACETNRLKPAIWLVTTGAHTTVPDAQQAVAEIAQQASVGVAPHASGESISQATAYSLENTVNDSALWGFGRAMMNEAAGFSVRVVDLENAVGASIRTNRALLSALSDELIHADNECEVLLGLTVSGERVRRVPRMALLPRPGTQKQSRPAETTETIRLGFEFPGQLRNLRWEAHPSVAPAADEVEVDIRATGLNFRDVMYALGMLSDEAIENGFAGPSLGLEFSGVVRRVGAGVTAYREGDHVVGFGPSSFGNRMLTKVSATSRIPSGMSFEAAATIPSTFFTVYYAFHHLARLEPGEKVLIHGAAGGVGIAAIQFAQHIGAEIYATAGSDEKRDFLRLMGVTHIYDSRSLAFADDILAATQGAGVDVVLNSLAGEAINRNLRVLKPFGRFLELGKRDFYENTRIGLRPFRNNISYFGIDADQLMHARPALTHKLFGDMMALFEQGILHPLPYRVFDGNDIVDAFRYMQQARQIGKIVVTYPNGLRDVHHAATATPERLQLDASASYLVTGGLGGFGLRTAQWLVERGARHLILLSRSGPKTDEARAALAKFKQQGVVVHAAACDVSDAQALGKIIAMTGTTLPILKGVVHAAVVIADGMVNNLTQAQIENTLNAKIQGAHHLHRLTRDMSLDLFVLFSSATTLLGNPGQSNYVAANSWLEGLAARRREAGLAATCVKWGAIDDVGFLARNTKIKDALQGRMGGGALSSAVALRALEDMIVADASGLGVLELDWRALARFLPSADQPKFGDIARRSKSDGTDAGQSDEIAVWMATLPEAEVLERFVGLLRLEVGDILRVAPDKIDPAQSIYDMGLDSLMGVELVVALEARFGVRLPVMALTDSPTLRKLAERLVRMLQGDETEANADSSDAARAQIEQIAQQHAADISPAAVNDLANQISDAAQPSRMIH